MVGTVRTENVIRIDWLRESPNVVARSLLFCAVAILASSFKSNRRLAPQHLVDPIFAANVSPMRCVNQTRTNVINRLRIHQERRAFFDPDARS
jgi:hypothetical protein